MANRDLTTGRSFSFRVWDNIKKAFVDEACPGLGCPDEGPIVVMLNGRLMVQLEYCCINDLNESGPRYVLQQASGQRDSKGKAIWEGDVFYDECGRPMEVFWSELQSCFCVVVLGGKMLYDGFPLAQAAKRIKIEVFGHIFNTSLEY